METVQLQCGNCQQLMGISVEHLGSQVQCPHCKTIVQTVARTPSPVPAAPNMELTQRESIFAGAEPTEDLFERAPAKVQVELPPAPTSPPPAVFTSNAPVETHSEQDITQFKPRPIYDRGVIQMSILIFLVPYSILTTALVIYLMFFYNAGRSNDPLQYLPDPAPKGGPQKVTMLKPAHDSRLSAKLRTTLKKEIVIGDLAVTPEKVRLTPDGDLELLLRARNESAKTRFEPMSDVFVKYTANTAGNEPYTFLQSASGDASNIYGGYLHYVKSFGKNEEPAENYMIGPRDVSHLILSTRETYRKQVANLVQSKDDCLWRVQLRRGFVKKNGKDVSATSVIGVEFSASEIEKI